MAVETINIDPEDRDGWLALRQPNINASEVPVLLEINPDSDQRSPALLFAEKTGRIPPKPDTPLLRKGRWLEGGVFQALADHVTGYQHWGAKRASIYIVDRERRFGCTPDGFAFDDRGPGIIQGKVVSRSAFRRHWLRDPGDDIEFGEAEPPDHYKVQTLAEMMLADVPWGAVAALVTSEYTADLRVFEIERDDEREHAILGVVEHFQREYLDPGIMPPFNPRRDENLIKALYPTDAGTMIDLTGNNLATILVGEMAERQAVIRPHSKRLEEIKAELKSLLLEHTFGKLADGRFLRWKVEPKKPRPASNPRVLRIVKSGPADDDDDDNDEAAKDELEQVAR